MLKLGIFTLFDLKSKTNSAYFCLEKLKSNNMCCFMLSFKKNSPKHPAHWLYACIEKNCIYDTNPLSFTLKKKSVLFFQKLSSLYSAKMWCLYLFPLVSSVLFVM